MTAFYGVDYCNLLSVIHYVRLNKAVNVFRDNGHVFRIAISKYHLQLRRNF